FLSIITMFMPGVMANFENDFKNIIALSTLRQLGLMIIILSFGYRILTYYHLLVHTIFKSMLFIAAGTVIHIIKNTQDIRLLLMVSNIALSGVPFKSEFYRKDLIMEKLINLSIIIIMFLRVIVRSILNWVFY
ncbi:PREDICTED: NADH-ubiquinone oxidoreductase chain 5-like, partial [Trachymyrmex septentrionalis]|uniref:NADH-ubiquinone oxidoreductase chain 5-like n=1 Tax=Trachymyrmex septentrionalis TaxID=34720 RepID=UPI00084F0FBE